VGLSGSPCSESHALSLRVYMELVKSLEAGIEAACRWEYSTMRALVYNLKRHATARKHLYAPANGQERLSELKYLLSPHDDGPL
jgi:hypothetical protein